MVANSSRTVSKHWVSIATMPTSTRGRARVVVVLLLEDFALLNIKGIEDVKSFSVCQRNLRLCGNPSRLTGIVAHHFHAAERGQNTCEEIKDRAPPANQ